MQNAQASFPFLPDCRHERTELRWRIRGTMIGRQCLECGKNPGGGAWVPRIVAERECGDVNQLADWATAPVISEKPRERLVGLLDTRHAERTFDRAAYDAHLRSPVWRDLRNLVIERCNGWCEGCRKSHVDDVHHLTYKHMGDELLYELVGLCRNCHERAHNRSA